MGMDHALGSYHKEAMHGHESAFFWVGNPILGEWMKKGLFNWRELRLELSLHSPACGLQLSYYNNLPLKYALRTRDLCEHIWTNNPGNLWT